MPKPILVGYDPREGHHAPVDFGIAAARWAGAPLIVVCVEVGRSEAVSDWPPAVVDADLIADSSEPIELLEAKLKSAGVPYKSRRLGSTSAARGLSEAAETEDAALLVVGSSRRSQTARVLAGSTAFRLLHGAVCPVVVAPRGWSSGGDAPGTIGVAYLDTDEGRAALHAGHALARRTRATLRVFTVVRTTPSKSAEAHCPVIVLPRGVEAPLDALLAERPGTATAA
jgi:nucleotide-binding universal stress UspA family protein